MKFQWNPLEYGDALGLTRGPLSGRAPGKLTDQGLDWQQKANPFISRKDLEHSNDIAPYIAAAIATLGGSAAGEAGGATVGEAGGASTAGVYGGGEALGASPMAAPEASPMGTGAFDMYGSQSSPTDASTIFDQSPHGPTGSSWGQQYKSQGSMGGQQQPHMGPRPHDYLAYLQGQPAQPTFSQPLGQGTFWGGGQSPMAKGLFGYG